MAAFNLSARLWRHDGPDAWYFLTLPEDLADEIRAHNEGAHRPFGSLPVEVTVGESRWHTSLFADRHRATYLLPVKSAVRHAEGLREGDEVHLTIAVRSQQ